MLCYVLKGKWWLLLIIMVHYTCSWYKFIGQECYGWSYIPGQSWSYAPHMVPECMATEAICTSKIGNNTNDGYVEGWYKTMGLAHSCRLCTECPGTNLLI